MHVISKRPLRGFWTLHPDAQGPLRAWYQAARREDWRNFADLRARFPQADQVGRFTVFNLGGNKYRLIAVIHYNRRKVMSGAC
jgi:mRNA interferase HigB